MSFDLTRLTDLSVNMFLLSQVLPAGVKKRCGQSIDRLTGRLTRHWRQQEKQEDADIDGAIKREGNKAAAQQQVLEQLVPDVAKHISGDPALLERAVIEMMGESYRKQENKDAVAKEAIKDIENKHSDNSECEDLLDEDWLNIFSSYAEKASSERTRQLWGRILSGEVRHPGHFSLSTLRILSEISSSTARTFMEVAPLSLGEGLTLSEENQTKYFNQIMELHESGLIVSLSPLYHRPWQKGEVFYVEVQNKFLIELKPSSEIFSASRKPRIQYFTCISTFYITRAGRELLRVVDYDKNETLAINELEKIIKENDEVESYKIYAIKDMKTIGETHSSSPIRSWTRPKS